MLVAFGRPAPAGEPTALARLLGARGARHGDQHRSVCAGPHARFHARGPAARHQPFVTSHGTVAVVLGRVYNHAFLGSRAVDTDALVDQFERAGPPFLRRVDGAFAAVVYTPSSRRLFVARDAAGQVPLYWAAAAGRLWFATDQRALPRGVAAAVFPPGHFYHGPLDLRDATLPARADRLVRWHDPPWTFALSADAAYRRMLCRRYVRAAVDKALGAGGVVGIALSGGLASTLLAAASRPRPSTWCCGFEDAPDRLAARLVAAELGTHHHDVALDLAEAVGLVPFVVHALGSADPVLVRAGVPRYLLVRAMRAGGVEVVVGGDGAAETWAADKGGADEARRRFLALHAGPLRAAFEAAHAHGLEARSPFVDGGLVDVAFSLAKGGRGRAALGAAFEGKSETEAEAEAAEGVPTGLLGRPPVALVDGVGASWRSALALAARVRGYADDAAWFAAELARDTT
jgi:asparagine synthase (glutamine-hydrolysing)